VATALRSHWPEYLIEASLLAVFMMSACLAVFCVEHPASPLARRVRPGWRRRVMVGILMGLTAMALIYSPAGRRSGAHMNPATTLTFFVLGRVSPPDALFYILVQFTGALTGVGLSAVLLGRAIRHPRVNFAVTRPGPGGIRTAWTAEFIISFALMLTVLVCTNDSRLAPYAGLLAALLVATYITVESPFSGMSMNPARTLGSAVHARVYTGWWVYFTAPPLAMLTAAALYTCTVGAGHVYCAKLNHGTDGPCLFRCRIEDVPGRKLPARAGIQPAAHPDSGPPPD
jgi:aquaporin Z